MIANKTIDLAALQSQAASLAGTHAGHHLTAYGNNPTLDIRCDTGSGIVDLCSTGQTALSNYAAPAAPDTRNQVLVGMSSEMASWSAANPSGSAAALAQHMSDWAAAHA